MSEPLIKLDPDGNAFPISLPDPYAWHTEMGLSKREYFAILAMQGMLTSRLSPIDVGIAQEAVDLADRLIAALNQ